MNPQPKPRASEEDFISDSEGGEELLRGPQGPAQGVLEVTNIIYGL